MHSSKDKAINIKKTTSSVPSTEKKNIKERLWCNENKQIIKSNQRETRSAITITISIKELISCSAAAKKKAHARTC